MRKRFWFVAVSVLVFFVLFALLNFANRSVTVYLDDESKPVTFWGTRVQDSISAAEISLREGDIIKPGLQESIRNNQSIEIVRASWVSVAYNNEVISIWTTDRIPGSILSNPPLNVDFFDKVIYKDNFVETDELLLNFDQSYPLELQPITTIYLDDNGSERIIHTSANTLIDALWIEGIRLFGSDLLSPDANTRLVGGEIDAIINRSIEVTINTKEQLIQTRVIGGKIRDAFTDAGIYLQGLDYSIPQDPEPIPENGQIRVVEVVEDVIFEQDSTPFGLQYIPLPDVELDLQQIVQTGEFGILAKRVRVLFEDGVEISRDIDNEWTAKESIPRIIGYGTNIILKSINTPEGNFQYYRAVEAYATSYSPCRIGIPDKCSSITASGTELRKGVIGVIRSWYNIMKGAMVYIPGYGIATIEDIGAGFPDRHWVDLGYSDEDWISWSGYVTVYFLTPIPSNIMYILN